MTPEAWLDLGLVALWVSAIAQVSFVVLYATRKFWRHFVGRALFFKSVSFAVLLVMSLVNRVWQYPHQLEVAVLLLWFIACATCLQLYALIRQMVLDRREGRRL